MLYKSVDLSPGFITMQGHKYSHICNLWGKFLTAGMSVQPPIQSLYLWVRCVNMQECSVHALICLLFPWVQ